LCARLIAAIERIFWLGPFVLRLREELTLLRRAAVALPAAMLILLLDVLIANFDHLSCYSGYSFWGNPLSRAHA
jgi:hypothetical protein